MLLVKIQLLLMNKIVRFVNMDGIWMREFVLNVYLAVMIAKIVQLVRHVILDCILIGIVVPVLKDAQVMKKYSLAKILPTNKPYVMEIALFSGNYTTTRYANITSF